MNFFTVDFAPTLSARENLAPGDKTVVPNELESAPAEPAFAMMKTELENFLGVDILLCEMK